jgi:ATP-dependent Clp protease ATP-binding subunit ClpA
VFNRFSKNARAVVVAAVAEAGRRGDRRVGTEHLLLGLLHDPHSTAALALAVDLESARAALHALDVAALAAVGVEVDPSEIPAGRRAASGHLPFTSAAKASLVRTLQEATRRKEPRLEPTHLLLALLAADRPDPAADLLDRLDVDPTVVRVRLDAAA